MSDFWEGYEPEPTRPAPMTKDELTEPLGCVVVRPLLANRATPPAQRQWVGLTETEVDECYESVMFNPDIEPTRVLVYQAIEAKLKEKNA